MGVSTILLGGANTRPQTIVALQPSTLSSVKMSAFTVTFSAFDRGNSRNLHFKMDGKRFKDDRTIKICRDVKYDVTVTVRPSIAPLE